MLTAIVTAADKARFGDATIYHVTYQGHRDCDSNVRWGYIQRMARKGQIRPDIICRNADGSDAGRRTIA